MKWHPVKILLKIFFISIISILFILLILTLLFNKIVPQKNLKSLSIKFAQNFLNRNVSFDNIYLNPFKGIVISEVSIYSTIETNSIDYKIDKVQLEYNFKDLLSKFKINIDKITIKKLETKIDNKKILNEINFYKNKVTKKTSTKKEKIFNINKIEILDSQINYEISSNKNLLIMISKNLILLNPDYINLKLNATVLFNNFEFNIQSLSKFSNIKKELFFLIKDKKNEFEISLFSTNNSEINFNSKLNFYNNNILASGDINIQTNFLSISNFKISDVKNSSTIYIKKSEISLKNYSLKSSGKIFFNSFKISEILNYTNIKLDISGNANFNISGLANKLENLLLNSEFNFTNSKIQLKNNKITLYNFNGKIIKNKLSSSTVVKFDNFNNLLTKFNFEINNIFLSKKILKFNGFIENPNLKSILTNLKIFYNPEKIFYKFTYYPIENLIKFDSLIFKFQEGEIYLYGNYSSEINSINNFFIEVNKLSLKNFITNKNIDGNLTYGKFNLFFERSKTNNLIFKKLMGNYQIFLKYEEKYPLFISGPCFFTNNIFITTNGSLKLNNDFINFNGTYNIKSKDFSIRAESENFNLENLKLDHLSGFSAFNLESENGKFFKLNLSSKLVNYKNFKFNNLNLTGMLRNNLLNIEGKSEFYKGILNFIAKGPIENVEFNCQADNIALEYLSKDIIEGDLTGKMNFNIQGYYNLKNSDINLIINAKAINGEIENTSFQNNLSGFLKLMPLKDIFYKSISAKFNLKNKFLKIENLIVICDDQIYNINGNYNLNENSLDLNIEPRFSEEFVMNIPNFVLPVLKKEKNWYYIKNINYTKLSDGNVKVNWQLN